MSSPNTDHEVERSPLSDHSKLPVFGDHWLARLQTNRGPRNTAGRTSLTIGMYWQTTKLAYDSHIAQSSVIARDSGWSSVRGLDLQRPNKELKSLSHHLFEVQVARLLERRYEQYVVDLEIEVLGT